MKGSSWLAGVALVASTVSPAAAGPIAPLLDFDFDKGSGEVALNSGSLGASSNGAISGAVLSEDSAASGGLSLQLDGDTDYVEIPDTFDYPAAITLEAWIKPARLVGQQAIYDDYGNPGVFLALFEKQLQWNISTSSHPGLGVGIFAGQICEGLWQHVAGTYDGATLRAYINGIEIGSVGTTGAIADNAGNATHIGADSATPNVLEYAGRLDDLRLFGDSLAPEALGKGAPMFICGELTGDCRISTTDALRSLRMAVALIPEEGAADVDASSDVKASDSLEILRIAVGSRIQSNACNLL
jgi:hypothetical protein